MIYEPSDDSYLLAEQLSKYVKDKSVLDMGTGSGIQAETALKAGAKSITAVDINKEVINALNLKYKKQKENNIKIIQSNLFSKVKGKFDVLIFNPPYLPRDKENREDKESQLVTTGGKKGDEIILKFLKQSKSHLNKEGIILLLLSSLTPKNRIIKLIKENKLKYTIISSKKLFFEQLEVWEIQ